jgi:Tfp pilus assembly protein PilW
MCQRSRKLRSLSAEEGATVIELTTVLSILGIVLAALLSVVYVAQTNLGRQASRSDSNDQVRLAEQSIDREVRSGNVLYDPAAEQYPAGCSGAACVIAPGMSMRVWTASNNPTRGGMDWCGQWRITTNGELQQRRWIPFWTNANDTSQVKPWRTVATGIMNRTNGIAAFYFASGSTGNLLNIKLRANNDASGAKGSTVEVQQSVSGRNTQFYPTGTHCGPATPDPALTNGADGGTRIPPY